MAENFKTNLTNVGCCYIKKLAVPVTITSFKKNLLENPHYPSLFSISDTLDRFRIPYEALSVDKDSLEQLTPPFIAYVKNQPTGKDFILVTALHNNEVKYIADNKKVKSISKENFLSNWENIILKAKAGKESGEKDYTLNRKKEINKTNKNSALICFGALLFFAIIYFLLNSLPAAFIMSVASILIIKILGVSLSVLLLIYETDKSNALVKSICTAGRQTNCNAVLQSKAARIMGMSWSEVGFFYFASTFLFLFFPAINFTVKICIMAIANCLAAPYVLFSIYYQWKVVKQWCPLCLITQCILLTELTWSVVNFWWHLPVASLPVANYILPIAYCITLPIVLWYAIKPLLLKAKDEPVYKAAYKRLLYNPETFNQLLQQQPMAPAGYENIGITIGNPAAENTIIKVCNPYCGPCAAAHPVLHEMVLNNKVNLKLIFTASNDVNDIRGVAAKHLLAINARQNKKQTSQALDDWYLANKKDYTAFATKYPMNGELKQQEEQIEAMSIWCKEAGITHTPTLFINGYRLPDSYSINEIKYIL